MTVSLPATAVLRISRGSFDPGRFAEVDAANRRVADYLVPAIKQLPWLISYYAGTSADGSTVHASIWDSDEHAAQMGAAGHCQRDVRVGTLPRLRDDPLGWPDGWGI